ncbi:MAG: hypothetical protein LAP85_17775 [Acidobacteriia bacterium]|nr:hypothetical protein [Terriglobia bacterium]
MELLERTNCVDLLLDLVFYEMHSKRLSPEMAYLLEGHLESCSSCRERILTFRRILGEQRIQRNFG